MAHEVVYKHPSETIITTVDFDEDLLSDTGLAAGSSIVSENWAGGVESVATVTTVTTSLVATVNFVNGVAGDDYLVTITGVGQSTGAISARVFELRVRDNHGLGLK